MKTEKEFKLSKSLKESIKNLGSKTGHYASIAAVAAVGSMTVVFDDADANAIALPNGVTQTAADADGNTTADDAITTNDIVTVTTGTAIISTTNTAMEYHDLISANADSAVALTGAGGLTLNGDFNAASKDLVVTVASASKLTLEGNMLQATGEVASVILAGSTMNISSDATQTIAGTILSDSGDDGVLNFSGTGAKTVSGVIGGAGTDELGSITVAAGSSVEFNATMDSLAITNLGTMQIDAASKADTISNSGTLKVNHTLDKIDASAVTAITMHTQGSILAFNSAAATDQDISVVATADGYGTIQVDDISGGAAAEAVTLSGGDIGTNTVRIGAINIGSATSNGALTSIAGDVIFADAMNITGGDATAEESILTLAANATVTDGITLTQGAGNAKIISNNDATITADITNAGAAAGSSIIAVSGSSKTTNFLGNVGATGVGTIDLVSVDTASAVFKNNVFATTLSIANAAGDATFSGTTAQTLTGAITATNGQGTLAINNATGVTVTGAVGVTGARLLEVEIADGSIATFGGAIAALTLDIKSNAEAEYVQVTTDNLIGTSGATTGALTFVTGSVIRLDKEVVGGTEVFDVNTATATAAGVVIAGDFTVRPSANFSSGTVAFIDGTNANMLDSATDATNGVELVNILVTDNAITDYTAAHGTTTGADVNIVATAKADTVTASELSVSVNAARALRQANTAAGSDTTLLTAFDNSLNAYNSFSATADSTLAEQVAPQTDASAGTTTATRGMTGMVQGIVSNRMASLRSGDAYVQGMSAGDGMSANSGFIQAFGSEVEQENRTKGSATIYGYDSETSGVAIGFDGMTDSGSTIGLSASFSSTDIDGLGTGKAKNSVDSYTVSVYADKATDTGYVEGSITYGINENSASRLVNVSGLSRDFTSSYDSTQLSVNVAAGTPNEVSEGTFITPFASFTGTLIDTDAYTEKSSVANDNLRLTVDPEDVSSMVGSLGLKAHKVTSKGTPMISLALKNEFGDNQINSSNSYAGGGTKFKTSTEVEELSAVLGLGYSFGNDMTSVNIGYEAEQNDTDYTSHYGSVKIVSKF